MANSYSANISQRCDATIELDSSILPALQDRTIYLTSFSSAVGYQNSQLSFVYANKFTANASLDLTALVDPVLGTKDLTGKRLLAVLINNLSATETLTIGGSYPILGASLSVPPDGRILLRNPSSVDVSAVQKTVTFSGSSSYEVMFVF